jgi:hypothetical protein
LDHQKEVNVVVKKDEVSLHVLPMKIFYKKGKRDSSLCNILPLECKGGYELSLEFGMDTQEANNNGCLWGRGTES